MPPPCSPAVCSFLDMGSGSLQPLPVSSAEPSSSPHSHNMLQHPCFSPTLTSLVRLPLSWFKAIYTAVSPAQTSRLGCLPSLQCHRWDVGEAQTDFLPFTSCHLLLISAEPSVTKQAVSCSGRTLWNHSGLLSLRPHFQSAPMSCLFHPQHRYGVRLS